MASERIVYIVDDDPAVRRSLERLLGTADFRVVSYATPTEFLDAVASLPAGCVERRSSTERWRLKVPIESPRLPSVRALTKGTISTIAQIPPSINNTNVVTAPRPTLLSGTVALGVRGGVDPRYAALGRPVSGSTLFPRLRRS